MSINRSASAYQQPDRPLMTRDSGFPVDDYTPHGYLDLPHPGPPGSAWICIASHGCTSQPSASRRPLDIELRAVQGGAEVDVNGMVTATDWGGDVVVTWDEIDRS